MAQRRQHLLHSLAWRSMRWVDDMHGQRQHGLGAGRSDAASEAVL